MLSSALLLGSGLFTAAAPPASAATASSSSTPSAAQGVNTSQAATTPVQETVSQFLAKASRDGTVVPTATTTQLSATAATTRCWYWDDWRNESNFWGAQLWKFHVELNWCGDGKWVRNYAYTNTWGEVNFPGWSFKGVIQSVNRYGVNWNEYEAIRQGSFCLASYFDCIQNNYPYVDAVVNGNGQVIKG